MERGKERQCRLPVTNSCVGRCNCPESPARRTVPSYSERCYRALRPHLYPLSVPSRQLSTTNGSRSRTDPVDRWRFRPTLTFSECTSAEVSCATTCQLLKLPRERFHSSKSGHVNNRASFPDNITPEERVRAPTRETSHLPIY